MFCEGFTGIDASHIGQREPPQFRVFNERGLLERRDAIIMELHHIAVRQRIAGLIIDFKMSVEFEHIQQLHDRHENKTERNMNINIKF